MDAATGPASLGLFVTSPVESRDEHDERYERCYNLVKCLTEGVSEKEAHDAINSNNARGAQAHDDVSVGMLVSILVNSQSSATRFGDLTLTSRDGLAAVIAQLQHLVVERYSRLQERARHQLLWLIRQLIRNSVTGTDGVCWNMLRQIVGGDVSASNIWLAENLLDIFAENRVWLYKHQFLTASVVYCYLRIIEDHFSPQFQQLRDKEAAFVVQLLRDRFADCIMIGRDLVRLLQHVARVPGIDSVWRDLLHNPTALMPNFTGLLQLLQARTSRRFLPCRLTPDMEKKIVFLTSHVRFGSQKRYQEWFQKQYLSTPESQSLRCDLIRFIVGVIHPTNELLSSDIIPRWAVIGWLLTTCGSPVDLANAKLALFYDWLFYDAEKDSIMNIEPAVLVMHHSLRPHPDITATLLDFMCRIVPTFYPPLTERVCQGMFTALRQIVKMRVLPSLEPLFINAKLNKELRKMLKERFHEFCATSDGVTGGAGARLEDGAGLPAGAEDAPTPAGALDHVLQPGGRHGDMSEEPEFSDEDDPSANCPPPDLPATVSDCPDPARYGVQSPVAETMSKVSVTAAAAGGTAAAAAAAVATGSTGNQTVASASDSSFPTLADGLFGDRYREAFDLLSAALRKKLDQLRNEEDIELRCEVVESICRLICGEDELSEEELSSLAYCLVDNFYQTLNSPVMPDEDRINDDALEESVARPVFVLMRAACDCAASHPCRALLILLLALMCNYSDSVARLLVYYITVRSHKTHSDVGDGMFGVYREVCSARTPDKSLSDHLLADMQVCVDMEQPMLVWLAPALYTHLSQVCLGSCELLHLLVSRLDGRQLLQLVARAVRGQLVLFHLDSFVSVIEASLQWETFEQYCVWQLAEAHELTLDFIVPLFGRLSTRRHHEAVTALLLILKREEPCMELMRPLLQRSCDSPATDSCSAGGGDDGGDGSDWLVSSVLQYWVAEYQQLTAQLIANLVNCSSLTPNKRKRAAAPRSSPQLPSTGQLLRHLDQLRQTLRAPPCPASLSVSFWSIDEVQTALSVAQSGCSEQQRLRFAELFALIDVDDDSASRTRRARKAAAKGRGAGGGAAAAASTRGHHHHQQQQQASAASKAVIDDSSDSDDSTEDEQVKKPSRKRRKNNQLNSDSD